jgi:hypothetical protein
MRAQPFKSCKMFPIWMYSDWLRNAFCTVYAEIRRIYGDIVCIQYVRRYCVYTVYTEISCVYSIYEDTVLQYIRRCRVYTVYKEISCVYSIRNYHVRFGPTLFINLMKGKFSILKPSLCNISSHCSHVIAMLLLLVSSHHVITACFKPLFPCHYCCLQRASPSLTRSGPMSQSFDMKLS